VTPKGRPEGEHRSAGRETDAAPAVTRAAAAGLLCNRLKRQYKKNCRQNYMNRDEKKETLQRYFIYSNHPE